MSPMDILILILAAAAVAGAFIHRRRRTRSGKGGGCGGCAGCSQRAFCTKREPAGTPAERNGGEKEEGRHRQRDAD